MAGVLEGAWGLPGARVGFIAGKKRGKHQVARASHIATCMARATIKTELEGQPEWLLPSGTSGCCLVFSYLAKKASFFMCHAGRGDPSESLPYHAAGALL